MPNLPVAPKSLTTFSVADATHRNITTEMSASAPSPFTRPAYPHMQSSTASSSSSAFQSCSSLSSLTSPSSTAGPMPSPSAQQAQQTSFFSSIRPQQQQSPAYNQSQAQQQQYGANEQRQAAFDYRPNRDGAGRTNGETKNLLSEYALIAEAAKRAQMAVLMRDMEGVEL